MLSKSSQANRRLCWPEHGVKISTDQLLAMDVHRSARMLDRGVKIGTLR
jgi:hypothetical protein